MLKFNLLTPSNWLATKELTLVPTAAVNLNQASIVQFVRLPMFGIVAYSKEVSSKLRTLLENVGVLNNVAIFPLLLKSVQIAPEPGYDLILAESRFKTKPFNIMLGPPYKVLIIHILF